MGLIITASSYRSQATMHTAVEATMHLASLHPRDAQMLERQYPGLNKALGFQQMGARYVVDDLVLNSLSTERIVYEAMHMLSQDLTEHIFNNIGPQIRLGG